MKINNLNGKLVNVNAMEYAIDWDKTVSKPQKKVSDFLRPFWEGQAVLSEFRVPGSLLRLDIFNINSGVIIEVSPDEVHKDFTPFLHKNRHGFLKKLKTDEKKRVWAEKCGYTYIELDSNDIKNLSVELFAEKGVFL